MIETYFYFLCCVNIFEELEYGGIFGIRTSSSKIDDGKQFRLNKEGSLCYLSKLATTLQPRR